VLSSPLLLPASTLMRPEKSIEKPKLIDKAFHYLFGIVTRPFAGLALAEKSFVAMVHDKDANTEINSESDFQSHIQNLRLELSRSGYNKERLALAFSLIKRASMLKLGMSHFDVQLIAGQSMFYGNVAEMNTGEGKSLTAILPAAAAALQGIPVHVITVNDYLTQRDADEMKEVYELLGLSVGCIINGLSTEERKVQYACDVVYCTNNELVFDYLKDSIALETRHHQLHLYAENLKGNKQANDVLMLQGLHYAVIDEVDSVLMDEARTPLIISGEENGDSQQELMYKIAVDASRELVDKVHFNIDKVNHKVILTETGKETVYETLKELGGFWKSKIRTHELIYQALSALYLYDKDKHYLIRDGEIQIIDEHTGRIMENRKWERGLHQMIEVKEDCEISNPRKTLARISYQNFFRKYYHLCGMTGTAAEVVDELWGVYGLRVVRIPTNKKCIREQKSVEVVKTEEEKWNKIFARICEIYEGGQPVLIGTHTVLASEILSELLNKQGIEHQLLNAKQDKDEAEIISLAGSYGKITIATNMAGRGTDIKLSDSARECGGLYVILTELHDAGRIDRQLEGRCARQGDPGMFEMILSAEDHLLHGKLIKYIHDIILLVVPGKWKNSVSFNLMKIAQRKVEKKHKKIRKSLLNYDEKQNKLLSFSGKSI
jgi:preprotein translocase subunit SecA